MSRREHSRILAPLRTQYLEAARAGDWRRCLELAKQMRGTDRSNPFDAETYYALGFAHEKLGELAQARSCYTSADMIGRGHVKAQRRLALLGH